MINSVGSVLLLTNNEYGYENCPVGANQNEIELCVELYCTVHSEVYWEHCWLYSLTVC